MEKMVQCTQRSTSLRMTRKKVEANNTPLENYVVYNYNMRNTIQDEKIASKIPADTIREHDSFVG
jgi:heat shock 70kDa protein 1/2/6/8